MFVIGTAGHVDHGKSTLVQALTGINADRLREEQERQMTLDLGFAWFTLPSGRQVSIVDVPGHEDFIHNMLAGIGGIDLAMLVVAADEAVMPQTREHLAILDLLQIRQGVVALTKADLVADPDWLALVQEEVREALQPTSLANAEIIPVSAIKGTGLDALKNELDRMLDMTEPRVDVGRARLPIDRAFSITGFGTVVTGTLLDGRLQVGDEIELVPGTLRSRIRNLQTHKTKEQSALPGTRVAANLANLEPSQISRGQVLARPGWLKATKLVDARLRLLADAPAPLEHNDELEFHSGTSQVTCHVRLLNDEVIPPGGEGWVQLRLDRPVALMRADRYILRSAAHNRTLAGGSIVQPHPARRYRRFDAQVIAHLEALLRGTPEDLLLQALQRAWIGDAKTLSQLSGLDAGDIEQTLASLVSDGQVVALAGGDTPVVRPNQPFMTIGGWHQLADSLLTLLSEQERSAPLSWGVPREEVTNRLKLPAAYRNQVLEFAVSQGLIVVESNLVRQSSWRPTLSPVNEMVARRVMQAFEAAGSTPPSTSEMEAIASPELLAYLIHDGQLVRIGDNVLFSAAGYHEMTERLVAHLREHTNLAASEARDLLGTSRKYALALLEDLDSRGITKRLGDVRVLRQR